MKPSDTDQDAKALAAAAPEGQAVEQYGLRLFVSGSTPRSVRAIQNIRALCEQQLCGRYQLEVVDLYQHPELAKPEQIVATPTLVRKLPLPIRKIIGDLSDTERVLIGLDIVLRNVPG